MFAREKEKENHTSFMYVYMFNYCKQYMQMIFVFQYSIKIPNRIENLHCNCIQWRMLKSCNRKRIRIKVFNRFGQNKVNNCVFQVISMRPKRMPQKVIIKSKNRNYIRQIE